jgi:hypothetical protein
LRNCPAWGEIPRKEEKHPSAFLLAELSLILGFT